MKRRWIAIIRRIVALVASPGYVFLVALLAALDSFIFVFPIDFLLIARVLTKRDDWLRSALIIATGSALGAAALAALLEWHVVGAHMSSLFSHVQTHSAAKFIHRYGSLGVAIISVSFVPLPVGTLLAAFEKISVPSIFLAAWVGRIVKYCFFAAVCAYAPRLMNRLFSAQLKRFKDAIVRPERDA